MDDVDVEEDSTRPALEHEQFSKRKKFVRKGGYSRNKWEETG